MLINLTSQVTKEMFPNIIFVHFADSLTDKQGSRACPGLKESCKQKQRIYHLPIVTINALYVPQVVLIYQVCQEYG